MQFDVIAGGFDPQDVGYTHLLDAAHGTDADLVEILRAASVDIIAQGVAVCFALPLPQHRSGPFDRLREPRVVQWLEKIIERVHFERVDGVDAVGRHENDQRRLA